MSTQEENGLESGMPATSTGSAQDTSSKRPKLEEVSSQVEVYVENADQMAASYVRTRHKNVRCFPRCAVVHKSKSFCGHSVYVLVKGDGLRKEDVIVVGEFRNVRTAASFTVGQEVPISDFDECFTEGVLLKQEGKDLSFAINPVRKWKFDGKIRPMDHYVFTVFAIVGGKVMAKTDTPSFTITPIWKTEGKDDGEEEEEVEVKNTKPSPPPTKPAVQPPPRPQSISAAYIQAASRIGSDVPLNAINYMQQPHLSAAATQAPPFQSQQPQQQQRALYPVNGHSMPQSAATLVRPMAAPSYMHQPLQMSSPYGMLSMQGQHPNAGLPSLPTPFSASQMPAYTSIASNPNAMMYSMLRDAEFQQKQQMLGRLPYGRIQTVAPPPSQQHIMVPRASFPSHFLPVQKHI